MALITFDFTQNSMYKLMKTQINVIFSFKLRVTSNSMELLNLLSNEHIIFFVDSIMKAVYRGVLERMYGPNTFIYESNTPEWRKVPS